MYHFIYHKVKLLQSILWFVDKVGTIRTKHPYN